MPAIPGGKAARQVSFELFAGTGKIGIGIGIGIDPDFDTDPDTDFEKTIPYHRLAGCELTALG